MTLIDQFTLSVDATFQQRVEQAMLEAAAAIASEADSTAYHEKRVALSAKVMREPSSWNPLFAKAVATDDAVAAAAGSPPVQLNVTDAQINNAVSALWNALAGARDIS